MRKSKQAALEARGWSIGSVDQFLGLTDEESTLLELRLRLSDALRARRASLGLSQVAVAKRLGSSQSRVAKMEAGNASVSFDLLVRSHVRLGASSADVAAALAPKRRRRVS